MSPRKHHTLALAIILAGLTALPAAAHPHVYVDLVLKLQWDQQGVAGIHQEWIIIRNFGRTLTETFDVDGNGFFDDDEKAKLRREAFSPLKAYHYYTEIVLDNRIYGPPAPQDFQARINAQGQTVYSFFLPCRIPLQEAPRQLEVLVADRTTYLSFALIYFDDPPSPRFTCGLRIIHEEGLYCHAADFGHSRLVLSLEKKPEAATETAPLSASADQENSAPQASTVPAESLPAWGQLIPYPQLTPRPETTYDNPFLARGVNLGSTDKASPAVNPFTGQ